MCLTNIERDEKETVRGYKEVYKAGDDYYGIYTYDKIDKVNTAEAINRKKRIIHIDHPINKEYRKRIGENALPWLRTTADRTMHMYQKDYKGFHACLTNRKKVRMGETIWIEVELSGNLVCGYDTAARLSYRGDYQKFIREV